MTFLFMQGFSSDYRKNAWVSYAVVLVCCLVFILINDVISGSTSNSKNKVFVDNIGGRFVLPDRREATFHGICLTESSTLQTVSGLVDITDEKASELKELGFNVIRIGFHWNLYEYQPKVFNETYLLQLESLVNRLGGQHGFYVILDMHQDQMSERFCAGHGIPSFYANVNLPEFKNNGTKAYPQPIAIPNYNASALHPPFIKCKPFLHKHHGSAVSLYTYYLGKAFQNLYDNVNGTLDAYGHFWRKVAHQFSDNPYILAYEILNEPWYGEIPILHQNLPGGVDGFTVNDTLYFKPYNVKNLQNKLNNAIHKAIRTVDTKTILLFEPAAGGSRYDVVPSGFTQGPGGSTYNDRQAFAYHLYCANATNAGPWGSINTSSNENQNASINSCAEYVHTSVNIRTSDSKKAGSGGATIVTEFGCTNNDTIGIRAMESSLAGFESVKNSWTIWSVQMMHYYQLGGVPGIAWKASPPPENFVNVIARPYVQYLANGKLMNSTYNGKLLQFYFTVDFSLPNLETEIFYPCVNSPIENQQLSIGFMPPDIKARITKSTNHSLAYVLRVTPHLDTSIVQGTVHCR